jgi:predicted permease
MGHLTSDLRFAMRQLRLNPTFTAVAALSLALGIGANTAIFQLIDAIRMRPLPVPNADRLAYIDFAPNSYRSGQFSTRSSRLTYKLWQAIRAQQQGFESVMVWSARNFNLAEGGKARYAEGLLVSSDFFTTLRTPAIIGRTFTAADDHPGCGTSSGAVISYPFWQREYASDPAITTRQVRLSGHLFPIIGVTPPGFFGVEIGHQFDVAIPLCSDALYFDPGKGRIETDLGWWLSAMGRLKPGWTLDRANTQLAAVTPGIMQQTLIASYRPDQAEKFKANKLAVTAGDTGVSGLRRQYGDPLWILLATTGLVLLIACANLANLLLARASVREREIAVRQAIGAGRGRLITQLLSESMLLAVLGTALGVGLASLLSRWLITFLSTSNNQVFVGLSPDWRLLGFMAAIAVVTCVLFGLAPALRATRIEPIAAMRNSGRGLTTGREKFSLRRILVVGQVALSMVLLVGALLFTRSLQKLLAVDPGFRPEGIIEVDIDYTPAHFAKERIFDLRQQTLEALNIRTGARASGQVGWTPVSGSGWDESVYAESSTAESSTAPAKDVLFNWAGRGYFDAMGIQRIAGRDFDEHDTVNAPKIAIVNERFAKAFFDDQNPVGKTFRVRAPAGKTDDRFQIVGLIRNTKYYDLREDFKPIAYLPITQDDSLRQGGTFVLRTNAAPAEFYRNAEQAIATVHPQLPVNFAILTTQLKDSLLRERLMAALAGAFGILAGTLAVLGLYGVIAYMVTRRRNEIGVRIALGATRSRVINLVLREAILLLAIGLAAGAALAAWAGRAAATLLYGLKPYDRATLAGAAALLAAIALIASYAPAHRASCLQPMDALRDE